LIDAGTGNLLRTAELEG